MRVLICGDRNWGNLKIIEDFILTLPKETEIIEGECRGVDKKSRYVAEKHGYTVIPVPAEWSKYGNKAGPIRNQKMLDDYNPDLVVAFHNNIEKSRGTKDMIKRAKKAGIPVKLITE